jgi:hypothetical protein
LRTERDDHRGFEILSIQRNRSAPCGSAFGWLRDRWKSESWRRGWQIRGGCCVDEANAAIGDAEEELGFVGFFDFGWNALNGQVGDLANRLKSLTVVDLDGRSGGHGGTGVQKFFIARKSQTQRAGRSLRADLVQRAVEQDNLRRGVRNEDDGETAAVQIRRYSPDRTATCGYWTVQDIAI